MLPRKLYKVSDDIFRTVGFIFVLVQLAAFEQIEAHREHLFKHQAGPVDNFFLTFGCILTEIFGNAEIDVIDPRLDSFVVCVNLFLRLLHI